MARGKKKEKELTIEEKLEQALVPVEEQPYKVPENWCWTYIKFAYEVTSSKRVHKEDWLSEGIPFYRTREIVKLSNQGYVNNELFISDELYKTFKATYGVPQIGDLLISGVGTIGVPYIIESDNPLYFKDGNVIWLKNKRLLDPKYTYYLYKSNYMDNMIHSMSSGTTVDTYTIVNANATPIPLPTPYEQQRIVDRIESLFAKLDEAKEKAQAVVDGFETRKAAILHKAFTGGLTELWRKKYDISQNTWVEKFVGEIADVKGGKRIPKGMNLSSENTGHPYIRAGNLKQGTVIDEGMMFVSDDVLRYIKNYTVSAGDVYITNVGACIGDCGIIPNKYDGANLTENAVKLTSLKCNNEFLAFCFSSNIVQQKIKSLIASATLGKLSIANIKTIKICLPSLDEQKEIVCMLDKFLNKEQQVKENAGSILNQIETMKKSILARAFRGELGTNDPTEESAVELLKRVL